MSRYKEAKETLEKYDYSTKLELSEGIRNNITSGITVEQFFMMKETCIELLDKATPNKVTMQEFGKYIINYDGQCKCGEFLTRSDKYCHDCGQELDWSE